MRIHFHTHLLKPAAIHLIQGHAFPYIKCRGNWEGSGWGLCLMGKQELAREPSKKLMSQNVFSVETKSHDCNLMLIKAASIMKFV